MNILHVNMSLDSETGGGTVERIIKLHKALSEQGINSRILTIQTSPTQGNAVLADDVTTLPCINKRWFIPFPEIEKVRKLVEWADVIHLMNHWTFINAWIYFLAKMLGKPYVFSPAGALTIFGRSKFKKKMYQKIVGKRILQNAVAVIAISPNEVEVMKELGLTSKRIHHIPNGVDEKDFSYSNAALFRKFIGMDNVPYLLFVGRLNKIKGPDLLLSAFGNLKDNVPHHLVFVGPDEGMGEQLKQQVLELNLKSRVHFTGYLGGDLKSSVYHGADLLVVPSRYDAMSIVALEAAISYTPVLLTEQCGFHSLAVAGAGIEVPATIEGLSEGLNKVIMDGFKLEKMGKCGRLFAKDKFSWAIMAKQFVEIVKLEL